jgi:hypothetical protein
VRWTIAKLAFIASLVTILAFAASQLFTWFFAPFVAAENLSVPPRSRSSSGQVRPSS